MTQPVQLISTLETYLKLATTREQAISANMANVDTPGYHTKDINFENELNRAVNRVSVVSTDGSSGAELLPAVQEVRGLMERPDGNNVSLDREGLLLSGSSLKNRVCPA